GGAEMDYVSKIGGHFPISGAPVARNDFDSRAYHEKRDGFAGPAKKANPKTSAASDDSKVLNSGAPEGGLVIKIPCTLEAAETMIIIKTMETVSGNKTRAAKLLGISLRSLQLKLKKITVTDESENI
ncbi:MAG TPA: helix-turn-helix domain-containing protein, partial [Candidatus Wallbacteria bacterium]|nr:helix-turn-helix domain-containing protein [Candidatus Wallbacteria bacterium]